MCKKDCQTLSQDKPLITHSDQAIRFSGYGLSISRSKEPRRSSKTGVVSRSLYKYWIFSASLENKIMSFLWKKKAIVQKENSTIARILSNELIDGKSDALRGTHSILGEALGKLPGDL